MGEYRPTLRLETGVPDDYRQELLPDHGLYGAFWTAWQEQDRWNLWKHAMFWQSMLPLWPSPANSPSHREQAALAYRAAEHRGLEPADVLDVKPDTLRKKKVGQEAALLRPTLEQAVRDGLDHAAELRGEGVMVITNYMLPRIFTGDELEPDKDAFRSVEIGDEDNQARKIHGRLGASPSAPLPPKVKKLRAMIVELAREDPNQLNDLIDQGRLPLSALQGDESP